jgi:putative DNA primase/helicase
MWRRIRKIPFLVNFDGDRDDKELPAKLEAEAEGILAWAVEGCLEWISGGLQTPEKVLSATKAYRAEQDVLGQFIAEACVEGPDYRETTRALFDRYAKWCSETRNKEITFALFGRKLTERGFEPKESNGKSWRQGLAIRLEQDDQAAEDDPQSDGHSAEPSDLPF